MIGYALFGYDSDEVNLLKVYLDENVCKQEKVKLEQKENGWRNHFDRCDQCSCCDFKNADTCPEAKILEDRYGKYCKNNYSENYFSGADYDYKPVEIIGKIE